MSYATDSESGNYAYVTARVRSRRAALFDDDDYRKLIRMGTGEIARFMEETEYKEQMNELGSRFSRVDLIEQALYANLSQHFEDLLRWSTGRLYEDIARYLRKFDAWNVKTVLRGVYSDSGVEAIKDDLIPAGELDEETLHQLAAANSIEEVVEGLSDTVFGPGLSAAFDDYEESGLLVPLENAVDRAFYETLVENLPGETDRATGLYVEFLEAEIDFRNVRNALRLARSGADIDPSEYYIEGGQLFDEDELRRLVGNTDQLVEHVRESVYGDDLEVALDALEDSEDLLGFERALETALLEYSKTLSNRYPLSVCPVLAYVLAKEREKDNVRAIARGREAGLSAEEIEQELVIL